jgi:hypothetical protein
MCCLCKLVRPDLSLARQKGLLADIADAMGDPGFPADAEHLSDLIDRVLGLAPAEPNREADADWEQRRRLYRGP